MRPPSSRRQASTSERLRPNDYATGLGYRKLLPFIRPTDGRLLFEATGDDGLPEHIYEYKTQLVGSANPSLAAQTVVPTVPCVVSSSFFVFPDDGAILYQCADTMLYHVTGSANPVDLAGYKPVAAGRNRLIVGSKGFPPTQALLQGPLVTPIALALTRYPKAFRTLKSGAIRMAVEPDPAAGTPAQLFEIALDGTTKVIGSYDFGPSARTVLGNCALEPSGALVCIIGGSTFQTVLRYTFAKPPELVYDEKMKNVMVSAGSVFGSQLVTGP